MEARKKYEEGKRLMCEAMDDIQQIRGNVFCPLCGFEYVHINSIEVNRGGQVVTISHDNIELSIGDNSKRGAVIKTILFCENGHTWEHTLTFHKGVVEVRKTIIGEGLSNLSDLWRD